MDNTKLLFRAWNKNTCLWYGKLGKPFTLQEAMIADWSTPMQELEFMQYIQRDDKNGDRIFIGDILRIRVSRNEGDGSHPNIHHGHYYLYAEVLDMRGNLRYNRDAIKELEKPMGKEVFTQWVSYDYRLFGDLYWCRHHKKGKDGEYIVDKDDHGNWKCFYDFEIVGNMKKTPELMDSIEIMKVKPGKFLFDRATKAPSQEEIIAEMDEANQRIVNSDKAKQSPNERVNR